MNSQSTQQQLKNSNDEIDLVDLLSFYLNHLLILVAAILIGALISGLYTHFFIPDRFTATSSMYMVSASSDAVVNLSDLNLGTSISNDYVELMKSRPVIEDVIEKLGLDYTYREVLDMVSLSVVNNTRIVKISVTGTDPEEAKDIANQIAVISRSQLPKIMEAPSPTIAEYAILPTGRSSPSMTRNVIMGALIALIIVIAILTVRYLMDDTIKTSEDIENYFGVMPLSVIPEGVITGTGSESREGGNEKKMHRKKVRNRRGSR